MTDVISRAAPERELRAYLAVPTTSEWGRTGLATAGFLGFAPDLCSGRGIRCVLAALGASRSGRDEAYEDIEAARRWLGAPEDGNRQDRHHRVLLGGGFALLSAPRYAFAAASGQPRRGARRPGAASDRRGPDCRRLRGPRP